MEKLIKVMDKEKGILQITTIGERWYAFPDTNPENGLPTYKYVPSVTWICEHYPKGIAYFKWLANKGWDEAEALKIAAGDKGSKVHLAIANLINGGTVKINEKIISRESGVEEELTLEEYGCIISFVDWAKKVKPKFLKNEFVVINKEENYAGTVDLLCEIEGKKYLVDLKTSQYIWPSHELQLSAYFNAFPIDEQIDLELAILQLGYRMNKNKYKFTVIEEKWEEFKAAKIIWANETKGIEPKQKDYPLEIGLV